MSYDVHLEIDAGGAEPVSLAILNENMTWNVRPMFKAAIGEEGFCNNWDGLSAAIAADRCRRTLDAFNADPAKFRALNPANGWGDFEGAREFIQLINDACVLAPNATLRVW